MLFWFLLLCEKRNFFPLQFEVIDNNQRNIFLNGEQGSK